MRETSSLRLAMSTSDSAVIVIGPAGSVAENIVIKLSDIGLNPTCIFDIKPFSPILNTLNNEGKLNAYIGDIESSNLIKLKSSVDRKISSEIISSLRSLFDGKTVIVCGDDGDKNLRESNENDLSLSGVMIKTLSKTIEESKVKSLICTSSIFQSGSRDTDDKSFFGLLKGNSKGNTVIDAIRKVSDDKKIPFSLLRYGKIIGGVTGLEPIPFLSMPLSDPELDPSYVLQSVVLADINNNKYAASEMCTRASLAEAITRLYGRSRLTDYEPVDTLVISVDGPKPSDKDWNQLFSRIASRANAELLKIEFASVLKPEALITWIIDSWFPLALIEADAATVRSGARPVKISRVDGAPGVLRVRWDDIQPDLSVKVIGYLEVKLTSGDSPSLSVIRVAEAPLQGEAQLLDKLVEGVNKFVYKKGFCLPL